jgi:hypothetical protein
MIWAEVKDEVAQYNNMFITVDSDRLINKILVRDTKEDWVSWYQHADQLQEEDSLKVIFQDKVIWHITITLRATVIQISDMLRRVEQASR